MEPRRRARRRALQALYQWQMTGQSPREILAQFREEQDMTGVDEGWMDLLVAGVVAEEASIAEALAPLLDRELDQVDPVERAALMLGCYELMHRPEIPYRVVIDEAVALAGRFGAEQGHEFVNGVLDRGARDWRRVEREADA